jgi:Domain of unknown function (DUF4412)
VGDYNAEVYTGQMQGATFTFWVTKDIPNYAVIKDQLKKMETLQEKLGQGKAPDTSKIDGVPVKTETTKDGKVLTMTLVSVKQDAIADADLQTPADYTEMQVPQMPGGAGAPPPQQPDGAGAPPPPQQPDGSGAPPPPQP